MLKRIAAILLILIIISTPLFSYAENKVIIEENFDNDIPAAFQKEAWSSNDKVDIFKFSWSENEGRNGSGCIVIQCDTVNDARYKYEVTAVKNSYYKISGYIKTENVGTQSEKKGANLSIDGLYDSVYGNFTGTRDWTYVEFFGETGAKQKSFTVFLRLGGYGGTNTGKAFFDDFKVEKIDKLPQGEQAIALYTPEQVITKPALYTDSMRLAVLITVFAAFAYIIFYRYVRSNNNSLNNKGFTIGQKVFMLICVGFLIRFVISVAGPQCSIDVNLFQYWANNAAKLEFKLYVPVNNIDYPPGYMYILMFIGKISVFFQAYGTTLGRFLIKLPAMIADAIIAYLIYKATYKKLSFEWVIFMVSCWVFNPVVIVDSAAWGQVDSVLALTVVLCMYYLTKDKYGAAGAWLAVGVLIKPQALFVSPIVFYALVRNLYAKKSIRDTVMPFVYTVSSFLTTFSLIALPFWVNMSRNWPLKLYTGTTEGYQYITVNALNFHFLMGNNWVADMTNSYKGIKLFYWGMLAIVVASVITWLLYQKNKRLTAVPYLMSSVLIYLVVNFGPRMHERYFFPIIALLIFAIIKTNNKWLLYLYGLISAVNFLIVTEIMTDLNVGGTVDQSYNWPKLNNFRGSLAFINVACSILLLVFAILYTFGFFKGKKHKLWFIEGEKAEKISKDDSVLKDLVERVRFFIKGDRQKGMEEWSVDDEKN